ncbi:MAG: T9SS type A sorting domain-containing protein [Bacteroidota bacterium]|nr:T9SS type A sorting domain-containing protein [Bacteroidota bacterium]
MKKHFLLLTLLIFFVLTSFSQSAGNYISATITPGSQTNSVYVVIKSNTTLTGVKLSTFQFEIGIPTSVGTQPGFSITSLDPTVSYATDGATETQNSIPYYGYGFSGNGSLTGSGTTYTAGVEYTIAEVFFTGNPLATSQVRLMQLPGGGSTGNVNFYIADRGFDVTNQPAQFYSNVSSSNFSNDGNGYSGSSWVYITGIALPVKLSTFNVNAKNNDALLNWTVENQDATSSYFAIERSTNGTNFNQIGTVNATSVSQASYSYTDNTINLSGTVYYRLKMVDKDGQFAYSDIKSVQFANSGFAVTLYPNPVQSFTKLNITLDQAQVIKVSVNDALGNIVQQLQITGLKGMNEKTLDLSNVPSGTYMVRIQAGENSKTLSVVKN